MKTLKVILLGIIFLCPFTNSFSQSEGSVWLFDEAEIKPEQVHNFEESLKEVMQLFKENSYPYNIQVYSSTGFKYYFVRPLQNPDSYDEVTKATSDCWSKIDQGVFDNYVKCFESDKQFVLRDLNKYRYRPNEPRIEMNEIKYAVWDIHYVKFDKLNEYYQVLDKFTELVTKHSFDDPISVLNGMVGTENPMIVGALFGKNVHDVMQQNQKMWDAFGEEGEEVRNKIIPLLRGRDKKEFWFRQDLSYFKE